MKKNILLVFLLINSFLLNSQLHYIDSIENLLKERTDIDTIRIKLLNDLAYKLQSIDPTKALKYAEEALECANEINDMARKTNSLRHIGIVTSRTGKYEKALEYFDKALEIAIKNEYEVSKSRCYLNKGIVYSNQGDFSKAIENHQLSLSISKDIKDSVGIMLANNSIGTCYLIKGNNPKAMEYFQTSLSFAEKDGYERYAASALNNLAYVEYQQENFTESIDYLLQSLILEEKIGNIGGIAYTFSNIGNIYEEEKKYSEALEYYKKGSELAKQSKNRDALNSSLQGIGNIYSYEGDYKTSFKYLWEALKIANEMGDKHSICSIKLSIAKVYQKTNNYKTALEHGLKSHEIAKEQNFFEEDKEVSGLLAEIYAKLGNYKNAYEHHKAYKELNDSLFNKEKIQKMTGLSYQYQFDKEKQAIKLEQEKKELIAKQEKNKQIVLRNTFLAGFVFLLIVSVLILIGFRKNHKKNKVLAKLNKEIQDQQELILSQNDELKTANETLIELDQFKEAMMGMIVHDLKNPLNTILNSNPTIDNQYYNRVKSSGKQMLNLALNILDLQKYKNKTMKINIQQENISSIIVRALEEVSFLREEKNIEVLSEINSQLTIPADKEVLHRVLVNLLTNAIKFSPINDKISLRSIKIADQSKIHIEIQDNGPGIPKTAQTKIFERFAQQQAKDSGTIQSTGLGLAFCKIAVEAHGGEIGVKSEIDKGSCFWFTLNTDQSNYNPNYNTIEISENKMLTRLSKEEFLQINKSLIQLKNTKIYEISKLRKILANIDDNLNENIKLWKIHIERAIHTEDQITFDDLLNQIKSEE